MLSGKRLRIVIACKMAMETLPLELVRARRTSPTYSEVTSNQDPANTNTNGGFEGNLLLVTSHKLNWNNYLQ
ncbi:hypothetical protein ERO13_D09G055750v2 [Gossypium hirsutum]|uniref:Uncharacterized protein n=3 Tax=Gossypium TaxID=3633 RepID=A0A0D2ST91_GOSRA|nr:hypothetical protein ES319_D09G066300v1 [Gossypium barbadense]KAG4129090.1 hypothetical protein ERO13_D09G055750v2 [Gossypium hirsutum]KJB34495.1 hypothetical protein B456_006G068800 [Gossypium raimondii]TYG53046.1 hypothetical protein ES288_D09G077300v1 [Gossypium darwinii]